MFKTNLAVATGVLLLASTAFAQQPAAPATPPARTPPAPLQVPNPHYVSIPMSIDVNFERIKQRITKAADGVRDGRKEPIRVYAKKDKAGAGAA